MNRPDITLKKVKKWVKLNQYNHFYRSKELEEKYQNRDTNKDPINKRDKSIDWKLNNYPYQWEKGLEHWTLWYHGDWKELESNYTKWIPINYSVAWINPPELRSIGYLPHCHAIVKNRERWKKR